MINFSAGSILQDSSLLNPSVNPESELGTVDPAYTRIGNPKVTFDKEATLSQKTYPYLGNTPGPGDRVVLQPIGDGWVISGVIGGATGLHKDLRFYNEQAQDAHITTPFNPGTNYELCRIALPDPGWSYLIAASATAYYNSDTGSQYDIVCLLDSITTGAQLSRRGVGYIGSGRQTYSGWHMGATVYTGTHNVICALTRVQGTTGLFAVYGAPYSGMTVIQVPV